MTRWLSLGLLFVALILGGCNGDDSSDAPPPDPVALLDEAAENIRAAEAFRMEIRHSGADYMINVYLGETTDTPVKVAFRRAMAQYVAEDKLDAQVSVLMGSGRVNLDIYAQGYDQWFRLEGTPFWVHGEFAPGFNPQTIIAGDSGFHAALSEMENLEYQGETSLEDGTKVYHITGTADGGIVTTLLVGMIKARADVDVEVFVDRDTHYPARLVIRQPETITENDPEPTTWTLDIYDINAELTLTKPDDA